MKRGYYWIRFLQNNYGRPNEKWTIASYEGSDYKPWQCVGCDDIFGDDELEVGPEIIPPTGFPVEISGEENE